MQTRDIVRSARKRAGLRQQDLAKQVGCAQQTVVDIESGKIAKSRYLADICGHLGLDYARVIAGDARSDADFLSYDFGSPVVMIEPDRVAEYVRAPDELDLTGADRYPCPVKHSPQTFGLLSRSDSMEPAVRHGDVVHIDPLAPYESGDVVCVFVGSLSAPMLRQVMFDGAEVSLLATRSNERRVVRLVDTLDEVEDSALSMVGGADVAHIVGRAIFSGRLI